MKTKKGRTFKRAVTILMSAVMVAETINCASMTAFAGSVSAGDVIVMDNELKDTVNAAEQADKAAYDAAQAALEAAKAAERLANAAGEAALETDADGNYTKTVSDGNGVYSEQPVLKDELENKVSDAEDDVAKANDNTDKVQKDTDAALSDIVNDTVADTQEKLTTATEAAAAAEEAKKEAESAATKGKNATNQFAAEQYAKRAQVAADKAQAAADEAKNAYNESVDILNKAIDEYNRVVADAEAQVLAGNADAQAALDAAQAALDSAKAAVDAAKAEYDAAVANSMTAAAAAAEAQAQADVAEAAANDAVKNLENEKKVDVEDLKAQKEQKESELAQAQADQTKIEAEQDLVIAQEQAKKTEADNKIAAYNDAKSRVDSMEDKGFLGLGTSEIEEARKVAGKTTSDWKSRKLTFSGWVYTYYTQTEIDAAKNKVSAYEADKKLVQNTNLSALKAESAQAANNITAAQQKKADAANAVNELMTEIAGLTTSMATVTDYIYSNESAEVIYLDKAQQSQYQDLLKEFDQSFDAYGEVKEDTDKYIEATRDPGFLKWISGLFTGSTWKNWYNELNLEAKYHGWKTADGTFIVIKSDKDNTQALIAIRDDKMYIASIDEAEFATYSATFDKVAAAQAAQAAAKAVQAEKAALDKYNAALLALEAAQARLDAAKLQKLNIDNAKKALELAQKNVDDAKKKWEDAQKAADEAQENADKAQTYVNTKPVHAYYHVLKRGIQQPSEIYSYGTENYSKAITGELFSGVLDEKTGIRDYSYINLYKTGIKGDAVAQYLKTQPTEEQLAGVGVTLNEGEYITWYVIKTEGNGYHVDGIISNQRFTIKVLYGYYDENGDFTEITKEDGTTYAQTETYRLGEDYEITSPVIDGYVVGTASVTGTATQDAVIQVECTKENTEKVIINYYRASLTGTLLGSTGLDVAVSKVADYDETIRANWLNLRKPGDCNDGVLVNYYYNDVENAWIANIVYSEIPVVVPPEPEGPTGPTEPEDPTGPTQPEDPTGPTEPEGPTGPTEPENPTGPIQPEGPAETPQAPATTPSQGGGSTTPAAAPPAVETETVQSPAPVAEPAAPAAPTVEVIEEEETPLAPAAPVEEDNTEEAQEVVQIEEEEAPLAAGMGNCWIHWMILILTAAYTVYELVRSIKRNKQIKDMEVQGQNVQA